MEPVASTLFRGRYVHCSINNQRCHGNMIASALLTLSRVLFPTRIIVFRYSCCNLDYSCIVFTAGTRAIVLRYVVERFDEGSCIATALQLFVQAFTPAHRLRASDVKTCVIKNLSCDLMKLIILLIHQILMKTACRWKMCSSVYLSY